MNIPAQNMEIEKIYSQLQAENNRVIAICSANQGEGVTSIALALAQRNLLAGQSTLVVDLNLYHPSFNKLLTVDTTPAKTDSLDLPQLVTTQKQPIALVGVTSPERRDLILKLRQPGILEQYIIEWQKTFDTIIFDTSPINRVNANNIPAERVAAACDGCLLVVLAGCTTQSMISSAVDKINMASARLLGCIYNDRDNPTLKNELLREIQLLGPRFDWLIRHFKKIINNSRLLTLET